MRVMNTSNGPVVVDPTPHKHVNTSRAVEEDMQYLDELPEILSVMPAGDWRAVVGGELLALAAFVAMDDGKLYGVVVGDDGKIDLTNSVELHPGFTGYKQANEPKENN